MSGQTDTFTPEVVDTPRDRAPIAMPSEADILAIVEKRNQLLERLLDYSLSATNPTHWSNQQGKPYLGAAGSEAVARRCAVRIANTKWFREDRADDKGDFYQYVYTGTFSLPGSYDSIEAVGTCSSRDQFLGTETSAGRKLSEVEEGNILKASYSNMMVNGVQRLLGLRSLTWERLAKYGITPDAVQSVNYKSGARGGGSSGNGGGANEIRFGNAKGKVIEQLTDQDLKWYRDAFARDLQNPEKEKYKSNNERMLKAIEAEIGKRASGAPAGGPTASPFQKIMAIAQKLNIAANAVGPIVKGSTGKASAHALTEEDVAKAEAALTQYAQEGEDIPF